MENQASSMITGIYGTYFILAIGGRTTDNQCLLRVSTSSNGPHTKIGILNSVRVRFGAQSTVLSWVNNTLQYEVISSELTNYLKSSVSSANPMIIEKIQTDYTQTTSRCRIQSFIFCFSSRKRTQRNDESFPSSLTMKWDRIWAPKTEFNWLSYCVTDSQFRTTRFSNRCLV
jgi:hypothetical protein